MWTSLEILRTATTCVQSQSDLKWGVRWVQSVKAMIRRGNWIMATCRLLSKPSFATTKRNIENTCVKKLHYLLTRWYCQPKLVAALVFHYEIIYHALWVNCIMTYSIFSVFLNLDFIFDFPWITTWLKAFDFVWKKELARPSMKFFILVWWT